MMKQGGRKKRCIVRENIGREKEGIRGEMRMGKQE